jgi:hypothetical protein
MIDPKLQNPNKTKEAKKQEAEVIAGAIKAIDVEIEEKQKRKEELEEQLALLLAVGYVAALYQPDTTEFDEKRAEIFVLAEIEGRKSVPFINGDLTWEETPEGITVTPLSNHERSLIRGGRESVFLDEDETFNVPGDDYTGTVQIRAFSDRDKAESWIQANAFSDCTKYLDPNKG